MNDKAEKPTWDEEQLEMLKRCSKAGDMTEWNEWREEYPYTEVRLGGANLSEVNLSGANLRAADLTGAKYLTCEQLMATSNWREAQNGPKCENIRSEKIGVRSCNATFG